MREQREKAKKSLADVRDDTGFTRTYICHVENGKIPVDDLKRLLLFCEYYDLELDKLINLYMEDKQYEWRF